MTKERILFMKIIGSICVALVVTTIASHSFFSPNTPQVQAEFISQLKQQAQSFIANALHIPQANTTPTTTEIISPVPRQPVEISQDKNAHTVNVVFPKGFVYTNESGVYR